MTDEREKALLAALDAAEASVKFYQERERHFARALKLPDGGQYRADWDAHLRDLIHRADAAEARARDMERERDRWRENYMTVADAVAASSTSPEHLAAQARETRDQRDAAQARARRLEAVLTDVRAEVDEMETQADVDEAHGGQVNEACARTLREWAGHLRAALADGADKES